MNGDQDGTTADYAWNAAKDAQKVIELRTKELRQEISVLRAGLRQLILLLHRTYKITDDEKAALFTWLTEEKS